MNARAAVLISVIVPCIALAGGRAAAGARAFDPNTVTTVEGEIVKLERVPHPGMRATGVHAALESRDGRIDVHLGPGWFVDNQAVQLKAGQKVTVTGSRVDDGSTKSLIATEVKTGAGVLKLREPDGTPLWHMGR